MAPLLRGFFLVFECTPISFSVGASLLAMVVNDDAREPEKRGALASIASKPAPTGLVTGTYPLWERACSRWSATMTHANRKNAAHWRPSPASRLLQVL
jgi:hypothetical protein